MRSLRILTNTFTTVATTKQVARKILLPPCVRYTFYTERFLRDFFFYGNEHLHHKHKNNSDLVP